MYIHSGLENLRLGLGRALRSRPALTIGATRPAVKQHIYIYIYISIYIHIHTYMYTHTLYDYTIL